jgi:hypothetical protein
MAWVAPTSHLSPQTDNPVLQASGAYDEYIVTSGAYERHDFKSWLSGSRAYLLVANLVAIRGNSRLRGEERKEQSLKEEQLSPDDAYLSCE